jgi:hypothetical protein
MRSAIPILRTVHSGDLWCTNESLSSLKLEREGQLQSSTIYAQILYCTDDQQGETVMEMA